MATSFLYDATNVVQELSSGTPTANLLSGGIDEVSLRTDAAGPRSFLSDALGSTLALTDPAGSVLARYTYEPFVRTAVSGATSANPYQYTGRENDGTGLYFYRARYYSPTFQRFISEDPIGFDGGINLYAYVDNNPIGFADPLGLKPRPRWWPAWLPWPRGSPNPRPQPNKPTQPELQTPRQAATQYCQEHGQLPFNIPFTKSPVTVSASATLGPANYSSTNDLNTVFPLIPWPEWLAGGASVDITINAPSQSSSNPIVGLGKNLSLGYFTSPNGPQGISLSLGPSVGPPINVSVPTNNACGMLAGGS